MVAIGRACVCAETSEVSLGSPFIKDNYGDQLLCTGIHEGNSPLLRPKAKIQADQGGIM